MGIESSNGSLGQGLSFGMGIAIGFQKKKLSRKVVVILGDGECNEGSVWETAASASELGVKNLLAVVDENGFRNDGANSTYQVNTSLRKIWESFGWNVIEIKDGNNYQNIIDAFKLMNKEVERPTVMMCKTIKGKGIHFMENNNDWHHNRITKTIHEEAIVALED